MLLVKTFNHCNWVPLYLKKKKNKSLFPGFNELRHKCTSPKLVIFFLARQNPFFVAMLRIVRRLLVWPWWTQQRSRAHCRHQGARSLQMNWKRWGDNELCVGDEMCLMGDWLLGKHILCFIVAYLGFCLYLWFASHPLLGDLCSRRGMVVSWPLPN